MHVKVTLVDHSYALTKQMNLFYMAQFRGEAHVQCRINQVYIPELTGMILRFSWTVLPGIYQSKILSYWTTQKIIESYYDWIYTLTRVTRKLELEGRAETTGNNGGSGPKPIGSNVGSAETSSSSPVTNPIHATIFTFLFTRQFLQ